MMSVEAQRLTKELLVWHGRIRARRNGGTWSLNDLVPYRALCERAGMAGAEEIVGRYLGELANWCQVRKLPVFT